MSKTVIILVYMTRYYVRDYIFEIFDYMSVFVRFVVIKM